MRKQFKASEIRKEFPVTSSTIYFDSAQQTPMPTCVRRTFEKFNAESAYEAGPKDVWLRRVEQTRSRVANLIGASVSEVAFTKNTSEGLNVAANAIPFKQGENVLMIDGDHPNNFYAFLNLRRKGVQVHFIPLPNEVINADTFALHLDSHTRAISLSHVKSNSGHYVDLASIGDMCEKKGLYFVVDAMQSVGIFPIDVNIAKVSALAFGCHKGLFVPQGLGVLYVRERLSELQPTYAASASVIEGEYDPVDHLSWLAFRQSAARFELGNYNIPHIHALATSIDLIERVSVRNIAEHVLNLGDHLIERMDEQGVRILGPRDRLNRSHIYVLQLLEDGWTDYLLKNRIRVSSYGPGTVRVSFAAFNTINEVDRFADIVRSRARQAK